MPHERYHSEEFLETVKRNLPPPESSGPQTEEGKSKVRWNALTHGLNVDGILPCKGNKCYYREICPLILQDIPVESEYCSIEESIHSQISDNVRSMFHEDPNEELIEEYQNIYVLNDRIDRYLSLNPDIEIGLTKNPKGYELKLAIQKKLFKIIKKLHDRIKSST